MTLLALDESRNKRLLPRNHGGRSGARSRPGARRAPPERRQRPRPAARVRRAGRRLDGRVRRPLLDVRAPPRLPVRPRVDGGHDAAPRAPPARGPAALRAPLPVLRGLRVPSAPARARGRRRRALRTRLRHRARDLDPGVPGGGGRRLRLPARGRRAAPARAGRAGRLRRRLRPDRRLVRPRAHRQRLAGARHPGTVGRAGALALRRPRP